MGKLVDLAGQRFGRLLVVDRAENNGAKARWRCQCDCGSTKTILANDIRSGKSTSCGCLRLESMERLVVDLAGRTYERLTVLCRAENDKHGKVCWRCRCSCGAETVVSSNRLQRGDTRSCGCLQRETNVSAPTKHGAAKPGRLTREYVAWGQMKARCENPSATSFDRYGGRGIKVCDRWRESFENFLADMGPKPSPAHSIDRYPDVNGNYEPSNCRWATPKEQGRNKRNNHIVTHGGESLTLAEWGERLGVTGDVIGLRLKHGWSDERAVTEPLRVQGHRLPNPSLRFNLAVAA